jgi:hypothetical protein
MMLLRMSRGDDEETRLLGGLYEECMSSVTCQNVYSLIDDTKNGQELFIKQIGNHNDSTINHLSSTLLIHMIETLTKPICDTLHGETVSLTPGTSAIHCECHSGRCMEGPFHNTTLYAMLILLLVAVLAHLSSNIYVTVIKSRKMKQTTKKKASVSTLIHSYPSKRSTGP